MRSNNIGAHDLFGHDLAQKDVDAPVICSGRGALLADTAGKEYIELNDIKIILGQCHPGFVAKVTKALSEVQTNRFLSNRYKDRLYGYFHETTHGAFNRFFLTSSGSEAVEWAVRVARKRTKRHEVLTFWNSIHGRTHLAASLSGAHVRRYGYGPLAPSVVRAPYPDCCHCPFEKRPDSCAFFCLEFIEREVAYQSSGSLAAVVFEPYQGGPMVFPPKGFLRELRAWTAKRGIELIVDEVQSGLGRLGYLYAYEQEGIDPDMLVLGKGLGNGLHIAALMMRGEPPRADILALSGGAGDAVVSCAAACAVYEELLNTDWLRHTQETGDAIMRRMDSVVARTPGLCRLRGQGLAIAVDVDTSALGMSAPELGDNLVDLGYLPYVGKDFIAIRPPLTLTAEQGESFVDALASVVNKGECWGGVECSPVLGNLGASCRRLPGETPTRKPSNRRSTSI